MSKQLRELESAVDYYVSKCLIDAGIEPEHMDTAMSIAMVIFNESVAAAGVRDYMVFDILQSCVAVTIAHMEAFQAIMKRGEGGNAPPGRTAPPEWWPEKW